MLRVMASRPFTWGWPRLFHVTKPPLLRILPHESKHTKNDLKKQTKTNKRLWFALKGVFTWIKSVQCLRCCSITIHISRQVLKHLNSPLLYFQVHKNIHRVIGYNRRKLFNIRLNWLGLCVWRIRRLLDWHMTVCVSLFNVRLFTGLTDLRDKWETTDPFIRVQHCIYY